MQAADQLIMSTAKTPLASCGQCSTAYSECKASVYCAEQMCLLDVIKV